MDHSLGSGQIFFENPLVRRVNRRIPIRIERFWRSTKLVEIRSGSGQAGPRSTTVPPDSPDLPGLAVMDWQRGSARTGTDQAVRILHHRPAPLPS